MKTLYLLRHAKSSWSQPGLSDERRPLNQRGSADAPRMGERFRQRGESLDALLSSPALRAHTTAELFAQACGYAGADIRVEPDLYFLGSGSIIEVIRSRDEGLQSLMLVFHNPDITHLVNSIDYDFRVDNIPTCGLVKFNSDITRWKDWSQDNSRFDYYDFPKNDSGAVLTLATD